MGYTAGGRGPTSVSGWPRRLRRESAPIIAPLGVEATDIDPSS